MREKGSKMTLLSKSCFLLLRNADNKTLGFNFIDTPGHPDFIDDVRIVIDAIEIAIIIIDVVEGLDDQVKDIIELCL